MWHISYYKLVKCMCMIYIYVAFFSCTSFGFWHNKVIRNYNKLANDNGKVGKHLFVSLCIWGKQVKKDIHILIYSNIQYSIW